MAVLGGASLILESNSNLLQPAGVVNSGNVIVKRSSAALMRLDYAMWSSPVALQTLGGFSPQTLSNRFYTYNPASNLFSPVSDPATTSFEAGRGYLIRMPNNHPTTPTNWSGVFAGELNNGNVTLSVSPHTYNAVGNPYPSALDLNAFIGDNNLASPLYFYRKSNGAATATYATYTLAGGTGTGNSGIAGSSPLSLVPTGIAPTGQGFITKSATSTILFQNTMRTGSTNVDILRSADQKHRIWLDLAGAGHFSQTMIAYMEGATSGEDAMIDGVPFGDADTQLTSLIGENEFAIQGKPLPFNDSDIVPLGFKAANTGTYSIAISAQDGLFAEGQNVFIKDNYTGFTHSLAAGAYGFTSDAGIFNDRFEIVYVQSSLGIADANQIDKLMAYFEGDMLHLMSPNRINAFTVYDLQGRLLFSAGDVDCKTCMQQLTGGGNQPLIVRITLENGKQLTKMIIKKG